MELSRTRRIALARCASVGLAVTALMLGGWARPAAADEFGTHTTDVGSIPASTSVSYCFEGDGWTAQYRNIVAGRMRNLQAQTIYAVHETKAVQATCSTSSVRVLIDTTITARGDSLCLERDSAGLCASYVVRLNPSHLSDAHQAAKTACHEIGHTVGLAHGTDQSTFWDDCMLSGTAPAGAKYERYNAHHVKHANSRTVALS